VSAVSTGSGGTGGGAGAASGAAPDTAPGAATAGKATAGAAGGAAGGIGAALVSTAPAARSALSWATTEPKSEAIGTLPAPAPPGPLPARLPHAGGAGAAAVGTELAVGPPMGGGGSTVMDFPRHRLPAIPTPGSTH